MKHRLLATGLLLALLCGCGNNVPAPTQTPTVPTSSPTAETSAPTEPATQPTQPATEPVYDPVPAAAETAVTVDGRELTARYTVDDAILLNLQELAGLLDAAVTQTDMTGYGEYACQFEYQAHKISLNNTDAAFTIDGESAAMPCRALYDGVDWYVPAQALLQAIGFGELADTEQNHLYYTLLPDVTQIPDGIDVPILMYHAVSDFCWGEAELFVSPSQLELQLQYLLDNGYTPIWFEDLPNIADIEKPVILTFDDGYDDNYTELYPLLEKYQVKATIFIIAGDLGKNHKMTAEQVTELSQSGLVSIQSHTMTHVYLSSVWGDALEYELSQSQLELTRLTGRQPSVLCYPTGYYSSESLEMTARYYQFGLLMTGGRYTTGTDLYLIPRHYVSRYTDINGFSSLVSE